MTTERQSLENLMDFAPLVLTMAEDDVQDDIANAWKSQREKINKATEEVSWQQVTVEYPSKKSKIGHEKCYQPVPTSFARYEFESGVSERKKVQEIPITAMKRFSPEPMQINWTHMECNIRVKSGEGGDYDTFDDEPPDVKKFIELSKQNLSAEDDSGLAFKKLKNDQLFVSFVKTMLAFEQGSGDDSPPENPVLLKDSKVFTAISQKCPEVGFPYELRERYLKLTKGQSESDDQSRFMIQRRQVLKNFHRHFCRRCYVYDCMLHGAEEKVEQKCCLISPDPTEGAVCGLVCYKYLLKNQEDQDDARNTSDNNHEGLNDIQNSTGYASMDCISVTLSSTPEIVKDDGDGSDIVFVGAVIKKSIWNETNKVILQPRDEGPGNSPADKTDAFPVVNNVTPGEEQVQLSHERQDLVSKWLFEQPDESNDENDHLRLPPNWTDDEWKLYAAMRTIFPNDFCKIAEVIRTKTCTEVYNLSLLDLTKGNEDNKVRQLRKRKKISQDKIAKLWFNHCKKYDLILARSDKNKPEPPVYTPCNHSNQPCEPDVCSCLQKCIPCEKFCACFHDEIECENMYPGCQCQGQCNSKTCNCFVANRECDIDLCGCGLENMTDLDAKAENSCRNCSLQLRKVKKVRQAASSIAGLGLYADEPIRARELIGEYVGEIISHAESDRRGVKYDQMKYTFLFKKDEEQCIDGMRFGNQMRFINSAPKHKCNCFPLIKSVYGNLRIGIYAQRYISKGEELFFDYMKVIDQQMKDSTPTPSTSRAAKKEAPIMSVDAAESDSSSDPDFYTDV